MKTRSILSLGVLALAASAVSAQSAIDAYNLTPTQLRGTARFIGMGGAFTSLGGDISCMTQNPAGLGIYRKSDLGLTFDISIRNYNTTSNVGKFSDNETIVKFDNIGYVGVVNLSGALSAFQWGVSYNRLAVTDRLIGGYTNPTNGSLTNYIAGFTNGVNSGDLLDSDSFDPFYDSPRDWLSILAYNSFMINNTSNDESYAGLSHEGTVGDADYAVRERGYTDEYDISFAGNFSDILYWGLGVGIVDMNYTRQTAYSESMSGALIYDPRTDLLTNGNAGFNLLNDRFVSGTGANLKIGLILRPVDFLRIGAAIHTPTWMHLNHNGYASVAYNYTPDGVTGTRPINSGNFETPVYDYGSRLNTPWRFMLGASATIGSSAILSVDYERVAYNDMKLKEENSTFYGGGYVENTYANEDVKNYFRAANILRVGAEYRITPKVSVRAGYNYQSSYVKDSAYNNQVEIFTSGTDPSYSFDKDIHNISLGIGYRISSWYIDLTYQHTRRTGTFSAYTPSSYQNYAPTASLSDNYNNIVITTGFRF